MDNREAVNWLINILEDIGKAEHSDLWHYEQALTEIKDMLKSAQPEQKWIPCSERLPEHSYTKKFWIAVRTDNNRIKTLIGTWKSWCGKEKAYDAFDCWQDKLINGAIYRVSQPIPKEKVIAWMPLPEPYKGSEQDE